MENWTEIVDIFGNTAAHVAAAQGLLPTGFDRWELVNSSGATVAHMAAAWGTLPPGFDQWDLLDSRGITVAQVAAEFDQLREREDDYHEGRSTTAVWKDNLGLSQYGFID
jgi:hypothetical protein